VAAVVRAGWFSHVNGTGRSTAGEDTSMSRTKQVATAAVIVVVGLFALLFTSGVASAADRGSGDGHSRSIERHSHSGDRDSRSDDSRSDDSRSDDSRSDDSRSDDNDDKGDDSGLDVAGIDLGQVTDAVSDLLNSLGDAL
jgi:hypothetical protein